MKRLAVLFMAILLLFSNAACAFELDDVLGGITSLFSPDAEDAYGPGETAQIGDIKVTLTNVFESAKNDLYTPKDGFEYIMIEFEFENGSSEDLALSTMLSFTTWCDGEIYSISLEALGTAMFAGKPQLDCLLSPEETFTGVIGYEIPAEWEEIIVEYKGDAIFGEKVIFAVDKDAQ